MVLREALPGNEEADELVDWSILCMGGRMRRIPRVLIRTHGCLLERRREGGSSSGSDSDRRCVGGKNRNSDSIGQQTKSWKNTKRKRGPSSQSHHNEG